MIESIALFWADWKFEIIAGIFVAALPYLKKRYNENVLLATIINATTERIAENLEGSPHADTTPKTKAERRRKIRAQMAKQARKVNRGTGKGSKKGGGKVK